MATPTTTNTTTMTTTMNDSPLDRLLSLASSLHNTSGNDTSSSDSPSLSSSTSTLLSLRQLVSVHESLCQAVIASSSSSSSLSLSPSSDRRMDRRREFGTSESCASESSIDALLANNENRLEPKDAEMVRTILGLAPPSSASTQSSPSQSQSQTAVEKDDTTTTTTTTHTTHTTLLQEKQQLLVLQYLLVRLDYATNQGLAAIILPFLLASERSEGMREALLDAAFLPKSKSRITAHPPRNNDNDDDDDIDDDIDDDDDDDWFTQVLLQCRSTSTDHGAWNTTCRLLVRLLSEQQQQTSTCYCPPLESMIRVCMHDKVLSGIHLAAALISSSSSQHSEQQQQQADRVLRPLTTWLLPLLYPPPTKSTATTTTTTDHYHYHARTVALWKRLSELMEHDQHYLIVTAVLCTVLPSLLKQELPITSSDDTTTTTIPICRPVFHPSLWKLIFSCVCKGMQDTSLHTGMMGRGAAAAASGNSSSNSSSHQQDSSPSAVHQLLRRRGLYLLRLLVEQEEDKDKTAAAASSSSSSSSIAIWKKYTLCFEALEMESEQHLVDQVWNSVAELCAAAAAAAAVTKHGDDPQQQPPQQQQQQQQQQQLPTLTWDWIGAMLARVLLSDAPVLRKLGLYRLLNGHVGVSVIHQQHVDPPPPPANNNNNNNDDNETNNNKNGDGETNNNSRQSQQQQQQQQQQQHDNSTTTSTRTKKKKKKTKGGGSGGKQQQQQNQRKKNASAKKAPPPAPLSLISTDFVTKLILPSYDSLCSSIGTVMQFEEKGKIRSDDLSPRLAFFLGNYVRALENHPDRLQCFLRDVLQESVLCGLRTRTALLVYRAIASVLPTTAPTTEEKKESEKESSGDGQVLTTTDTTTTTITTTLPLDQDMMDSVVRSFQLLLGTGSLVLSFRKGLLHAFATMLAHSSTPTTTVEPKVLLRVLSLYPLEESSSSSAAAAVDQDDETEKGSSVQEEDEDEGALSLEALRRWLSRMGESPAWACNVGGACASAYVSGQLLSNPAATTATWDPDTGITELERSTGSAVALLCHLAAAAAAAAPGGSSTATTAGELLWPAIHKGLSFVPAATAVGSLWPSADRVARALVLLEGGCRLGVLSGMGNGELVVDQKDNMMPPPPHIEGLLSKAVDFILHHIQALTTWEPATEGSTTTGSLRSTATKRTSSMLALLVSQMQVLHEAYPSSMTTSNAVNEMLQLSVSKVMSSTETGADALDVVKYTALAYAALSAGAEPSAISASLRTTCSSLLHLQFEGRKAGISKSDQQAARSVFQYAKWGALSRLLPMFLEQVQEASDDFCSDLFNTALDAVHATPANALLPLFDCVLVAAQHWLPEDDKSEEKVQDSAYAQNLEKIISTLFEILTETSSGRTSMYMLNEICALIFRPQLLVDEYERLQDECEALTPTRDAFHKLIKMAGTKRNHISKCVISWASVGWLGIEKGATNTCGLGAIPYRDDIASLLLHKETKMDEASTHQEPIVHTAKGAIQLPPATSDLSVVRGFILFFISKLPNADAGLHPKVLTDLLHPIISNLLKDACGKAQGNYLMIGSTEYCQKMRGWQALCVLSRFVTDDIAGFVCDKAFGSLEQIAHGQIRYFIEIFMIQCSRMHPVVFGKALVKEIRRTDLSIQHVSSVMIIGGNLIVGRYQLDFFRQFEGENSNKARLHEVLAGSLPWLSSTQGFSRAIAQLIVHKVIPLVVDVDDNAGGSDWYLQSIYNFLEENHEMKRLRKKQSKVFEQYDVDRICTPEGILSIPVDEGHEANPLHVVEAIKRCLEQVYVEAHEKDAPMWKEVESMLKAEKDGTSDAVSEAGSSEEDESSLVNFQRKIIPLDSLNLALDETRQQSLRNATGRKKQQLIVCASLIDKVPNVAGLARTAEIFAADRLVIPDKTQCKMDNFKSISVGAGEWIQIDECKEDNLLQWLRQQKENGYYIVGVEQTSSSISIEELAFPERTVLLLGKEKEGIPVEFLQAVDICVEIPQLGIIRSLNVHVSGAVAIWEYTKQMLTQK